VSTLVLSLLLLAGDDLESIERRAVKLPPDEAIALVGGWADAHRGEPEVAKAWLWQAQVLLGAGRYGEGRALLEKVVRDATGDSQLDAKLALAEASFAEGKFRQAEGEYAALRAPAGSRWEYQAQMRAVEAHAAATRELWLWFAAASLLAVLAVEVIQSRRSLLPPPDEFVWSGPVLVLFAIAGLTRPPGERFSVVAIALGGMVLAWVDGAWLRQRRLAPAARAGAAVVALGQVAALVFCAVVAGGLWPRLIDTIAGGVE
jgi:tetratricopeptide (TPR) repeat protein